MKTHNATIYHCVTCGRVEHTALDAVPPQCCGEPMTKSAGETIGNGDAAREMPGAHTEVAPSEIDAAKKPR